MARCGLEDLDGLSSMNSLDELYLAYNDIYDISACSLLEHLQILDLEGYVSVWIINEICVCMCVCMSVCLVCVYLRVFRHRHYKCRNSHSLLLPFQFQK